MTRTGQWRKREGVEQLVDLSIPVFLNGAGAGNHDVAEAWRILSQTIVVKTECMKTQHLLSDGQTEEKSQQQLPVYC